MNTWSIDTSEEWETDLLTEVCRTVEEIWTIAGKPGAVYLAVDGVVPMAKIRQQRVRRFKSAWLSSGNSWDTNAITPGTAFMDSLTERLTALASKLGWKHAVSGVREEGEGEHKIMRYIRDTYPKGGKSIVVYGLDADLILLSMLVAEETSNRLWLLREKQEFGLAGAGAAHSVASASVAAAATDMQEYSIMQLAALQEKLYIRGYQSLLNYVALMSLMGNDFLPHSVTHKLADNGHELVLRELRSMTDTWQLVLPCTSTGAYTINTSVLQDIAKRWSQDEERNMIHMIQKKKQQAIRSAREELDEKESLPLQWNVESVLCEDGMPPSQKLRKEWRSMYWQFVHPSASTSLKQHACNEYVKGCQWILDYYTGRAVDMTWLYPYWIPPLWSDMASATLSNQEKDDTTRQLPITPEEQLAMVLPLNSWGLVRGPHRRLPIAMPHLWPKTFTFFSLGRKWMWECEARIPVLTVERLRDCIHAEMPKEMLVAAK